MYDVILAEVSDKEFQNFLSKAGEFLITLFTKLFDGILTVLNMLPSVAIGIIFGVILVVWLWKKVAS